jgi:hypothetical protein
MTSVEIFSAPASFILPSFLLTGVEYFLDVTEGGNSGWRDRRP